jgi:hypothetical protein
LPEALVRIPMVFAGGGIKPGAFEGVFTSNADFMPTVCEAIGAAIPIGVQGRSLWPLLRGEDYPAEEFRSIYAGAGVGGLYYDEKDGVGGDGQKRLVGDTLNKVTQSGNQQMVRMDEWKLIYDMMGYGQLYHLPSDPAELNNRFGQPDVAEMQATLMAELAMWAIRNQDSLPTGPQNAKYQTKWARPHSWYAPYRRAPAGSAYIPSGAAGACDHGQAPVPWELVSRCDRLGIAGRIAPPSRYVLDANGVNLATGDWQDVTRSLRSALARVCSACGRSRAASSEWEKCCPPSLSHWKREGPLGVAEWEG